MDTAAVADSSGPADRTPRVGWFVISWIAVASYALWWLDRRGRGLVFFYDEWGWLLERRAPSASTLLEPHNGHLSVIPVAVYQVLTAAFGLDHYRPYRIVGLLAHVGVATLIALLVARRRSSVQGLAAGAVVLWLGAGWQNIFWPFQIGMMGSLGFGLIAWMCLDGPATTRRSSACSLALLGALGCSGVGVPLTVGVAVRLAPDRRRAVRVLAPVGILYLAWYVAAGESEGAAANLKHLLPYLRDAAAGSVGALAGRTLDGGLVGLVLFAVVVAASVRRFGLSSRLAGAIAIPLTTWLLQVYTRGDLAEPTASRYMYVGAVMLLLVLAETPGMATIESDRRFADLVAIPIALLCIWGNARIMRAGSGGLIETADAVRAELTVLEWASDVVAADFVPDAARMTPNVVAGPYLEAVEATGSPAYTELELRSRPAAVRAAADAVSVAALRIALRTTTSPPAPGACTTGQSVTPVAAGGEVVIETSEGVDASLTRLADPGVTVPVGSVPPGGVAVLVIPDDRGPDTWTLTLSNSQAILCS